MDSNTRIALEVFSKSIRNISINENVNSELYRAVAFNDMVRNDLEDIASMFEMNLLVVDGEGIFMVAKPTNKIFGYTNEELRDCMGLKNNTELYIAYFIIYCVISTFYIQSNYRSQVEYITSKSLLDRVDDRLKAISQSTDVKNSDSEEAFNNIYVEWSNLSESTTKNKDTVDVNQRRGKSQFAIINKTLDFLVDNRYLIKDVYTNRYSITSKFGAIVQEFFDSQETKQILQDLLDEEVRSIQNSYEEEVFRCQD